jgi:hypothetical protein
MNNNSLPTKHGWPLKNTQRNNNNLATIQDKKILQSHCLVHICLVLGPLDMSINNKVLILELNIHIVYNIQVADKVLVH